ncbi:MAG: radical SAM protein [Desulfobacterota bacterium]|nr:radical SAM protein [Thermodesulfobacteriota bacterium]
MRISLTPLILPIFLPHRGCPHRCLFCNQKAWAEAPLPPGMVSDLIEAFLGRSSSLLEGREKQVAFYGGSFTAMDKEDQLAYLRVVQPFLLSGQVHSIRLSTRPDALGQDALDRLEQYGVKTVELGVQSLSEKVLALSQRGHTVEDSIAAIRELKERGFEVGVHLMIGLPGDTCEGFLQSLDRVIELKPDFVRIHPTLVLRGSPLEAFYKRGAYVPLSLEEGIEWLKKGLLRLRKAGLPLARMGLQPTRELEAHLLAGPYHPALHQLVESALFYDLSEHLLRVHLKGSSPVFLCHPKDLTNLRGQRDENLRRLTGRFKLDQISINLREDFPRGRLGLLLPEGVVSKDWAALGQDAPSSFALTTQ